MFMGKHDGSFGGRRDSILLEKSKLSYAAGPWGKKSQKVG